MKKWCRSKAMPRAPFFFAEIAEGFSRMRKKNNLKVPGLCHGCVEENSQIVDGDTLIICYCRHNQMGGIYQIARGLWRLVGPISQGDFERVSSLQREGILAGIQMLTIARPRGTGTC